jgi:hypothetical protein
MYTLDAGKRWFMVLLELDNKESGCWTKVQMLEAKCLAL